MFNNLIESDSHREELARKSRFFLGTLAFYALLFSAGGVASIYAYDAHLENQNLELVTLLTPVELTAPAATTPKNERPTTRQVNGDEVNFDRRKELIADTNRPIAPDKVSAIGSDTPPVRGNIPVMISNINSDAVNMTGPVGPTSTANGGPRVVNTPVVKVENEPPPCTA